MNHVCYFVSRKIITIYKSFQFSSMLSFRTFFFFYYFVFYMKFYDPLKLIFLWKFMSRFGECMQMSSYSTTYWEVCSLPQINSLCLGALFQPCWSFICCFTIIHYLALCHFTESFEVRYSQSYNFAFLLILCQLFWNCSAI